MDCWKGMGCTSQRPGMFLARTWRTSSGGLETELEGGGSHKLRYNNRWRLRRSRASSSIVAQIHSSEIIKKVTQPLITQSPVPLKGCWKSEKTIQELKILVQGGKYNFIKTTKTWWDDSHDRSTALEGYKLLRDQIEGRWNHTMCQKYRWMRLIVQWQHLHW